MNRLKSNTGAAHSRILIEIILLVIGGLWLIIFWNTAFIFLFGFAILLVPTAMIGVDIKHQNAQEQLENYRARRKENPHSKAYLYRADTTIHDIKRHRDRAVNTDVPDITGFDDSNYTMDELDEFKIRQPGPEEPVAEENEDASICPSCRKKYPPESKFCNDCGQPLLRNPNFTDMY